MVRVDIDTGWKPYVSRIDLRKSREKQQQQGPLRMSRYFRIRSIIKEGSLKSFRN